MGRQLQHLPGEGLGLRVLCRSLVCLWVTLLLHDILAASFSLQASLGEVQTIESRRSLRLWSDPPTGGDWNRSATGVPT